MSINLSINHGALGSLSAQNVLRGIYKSIANWKRATGINFIIKNPQPNLKWIYIGLGTSFNAAGWSTGDLRGDNKASITLNPHDPRDWTIDKVEKIMNHEFGHAILDMGHSGSIYDVMHSNGSAAWFSRGEIDYFRSIYGNRRIVPNYIDDDIKMKKQFNLKLKAIVAEKDKITLIIKRLIENRNIARENLENTRTKLSAAIKAKDKPRIEMLRIVIDKILTNIKNINANIALNIKERDQIKKEYNIVKEKRNLKHKYIAEELKKYN